MTGSFLPAPTEWQARPVTRPARPARPVTRPVNHLRYWVSLNQATVLKRTYFHKTLQKFRENHFSLPNKASVKTKSEIKPLNRIGKKEQWAKRMMGTGNEISGEATKH